MRIVMGRFVMGDVRKPARILCVPSNLIDRSGLGDPAVWRNGLRVFVCLFVFIILIIIIIINKVKRKDPTHTQTVRDTRYRL
jgi:hypothetical protein